MEAMNSTSQYSKSHLSNKCFIKVNVNGRTEIKSKLKYWDGYSLPHSWPLGSSSDVSPLVRDITMLEQESFVINIDRVGGVSEKIARGLDFDTLRQVATESQLCGDPAWRTSACLPFPYFTTAADATTAIPFG